MRDAATAFPVEICNDGLDNDCDGAADDGCECGDDECMPGETYENCPADCPAPANGTPCDDGNLCTTADAYQSGACVPGASVSCDAGNACVVGGTCDPATGCSATKVDCDDTDPCTIDSCDPAGGCVHTPAAACQGDADHDGYPGIAAGGTDCDDANPDVHPGAPELCNGIDDDCDTVIDRRRRLGRRVRCRRRVPDRSGQGGARGLRLRRPRSGRRRRRCGDAGRTMQLVAEHGHPADHPTALAHQEGEYLKALLLRG